MRRARKSGTLMPQLPFDPSQAVTFDFAHGRVQLDDAPACVLVPAPALVELARAAGGEGRAILARAVGAPIGRRVARRLSSGEGPLGASIETVVEQLGGEFALVGLGSLSLERWGRALIFVFDHSPLGDEGDELLAALLDAALESATGRPARCVPLMRDAARVRLLVANERAAERVRAWLGEGVGWGEVLARLHAAVREERGVALGDARPPQGKRATSDGTTLVRKSGLARAGAQSHPRERARRGLPVPLPARRPRAA